MAARKDKARSYATVALAVTLALLVSDASGSGVSYTYDLPGRVTTAFYSNNMCVTYTYDATGNRTTQTNATAASPAWGSGLWGCFNWTP